MDNGNPYQFHIANILTLFRVVIVPFFILSLFGQSLWSSAASLILFLLASLSDYLDGRLARKYKIQSSFGEFIDPLADKILVGGAFLSFTLMPDLPIPLPVVLIILFRELLVTLLRVIAIRKRAPIKTEYTGKIKTAVQMGTIIVILGILVLKKGVLTQRPELLNRVGKEFWISLYGLKMGGFMYHLPLIFVSLSAGFALVSMVQYILKNFHAISTQR